MISKRAPILPKMRVSTISEIIRVSGLVCALLVLWEHSIFSQVITNEGAAISIIPGTVVISGDAMNNSGILINDGTFTLSRNYSSTATTSGNGLYLLGGSWTNSGGIFVPGSSMVIFNGSDDQSIIRSGGETFYNLSVENSGAPLNKRLGISNDVTVLGTLTMSLGNIDAGTYLLYLSNPAVAALQYTSTTQSRIFGKFERGVNQAGTYLFPLGTISFYNPLNLITNNISNAGSVLSQFFTLDPGNAGLPIPDPPVEIHDRYPDGYWNMTANNGFSIGDFSINMDAAGFADTIRDVTRVIKRIDGGNWAVDGTHSDAVGNVVHRNNLQGGISSSGTQFALGRVRPLIITQPRDTTVCENINPTFTVIATGAEKLKYAWYKEPGILIENGPHYSGARTATLTIIGAVLSDAGEYYCIITDRYRNSTRSENATLVVMKIPVAIVTPPEQNHECSRIAFEDIVLDLNYWDPGTTFVWTRDNPSGIITNIPLNGSASNIGDVLSGSFINTSNDPVKITFLITPIGPDPTYCVGTPVPAAVVVNPTPRVIPINSQPTICYGKSTEIILTTPTTMTKGNIVFDYFVAFEGLPGDLVGNNDPNTLYPNDIIRYSYDNNSDTVLSVFYTITPRNNDLGCIYDSINIPEVKVHPKPLQDMYISTPFTCTGGSDGIITAILSRGSKPDILTWTERPWAGDTTYTTSANSNQLIVRYEGEYNLKVEDNFGCENSINNLEVLGATFKTNLYPVDTTGFGTTCHGSADGEIWIWEDAASTAEAPFVYWLVLNGQDTLRTGTLLTKGEVKQEKNLPSGEYRLIIRDVNGCFNTNSLLTSVTEPPEINVEFVESDHSGYNISCRGYDDGSVRITSVSGGNGGPFSYLWTTSGGYISGPDNTAGLDTIPAGTYYLTTTDRKGCTQIDTIIIDQPEGMTLDSHRLSWTPDSVYNISCRGGNTGFIEMAISGGAQPYNYLWTDSASFTATTKDIYSLFEGTYVCKVTDHNGCELKIPPLSNYPAFTLTEPAPLYFNAITSTSADGDYNINCHDSTGWIDLNVTGGSGLYEYTWSTEDGSEPDAGQGDQNSLAAGTYTISVRDSYLCVRDTVITLTQPDSITATLVPTHITCQPAGFANGSISLTASGGIAPYGNWSWSNGATTKDITGLTEGYYIVNFTDANGCPVRDSVRINLPPPIAYTANLSQYNGFNVTCYGKSDGSIDITMDSTQYIYEYEWQKEGGEFTEDSEDITGLTAGRYILILTDPFECKDTATFDITQPDSLYMNVVLSSSIAGGFNINCAGDSTGTIEIDPVNEAGSVTYLWADGATSATRGNLPAGDYSVYIEDLNGCRAEDTLIILAEPDSLKLSFEVIQPWCPDKPDGEIRLTATGGVMGAEYLYEWSDGSDDRDITNILEGNFVVKVTDQNECSIIDSVLVEPQNETCLIIPNAFSPNGDGFNDEWNIGLTELYPQMEIKMFNRWGETVWRSEKGYPQPWDGRSNGKPLPIDSYHYIIDLGNKRKPIIGNITIVR